MKAGIIGLPNVGKSTLFNALTAAGAESSNYPFCTIEPNIGMVPVPDDRLRVLEERLDVDEVIPAALHLVDIAGLVKGANEGEGMGNKFLSHIREMDALLHVVRCFTNPDVVHVEGDADPLRDIETIETELMLADLQLVEGALHKAEKASRGGTKEDVLRARLLHDCQSALAEGKPVRELDVHDEERAVLKGLGLLSAKKILYVANIDEKDIGKEDIPQVAAIAEYAKNHRGGVIPVCTELEEELSELDEADRREMLESLGLTEPALNKVARAAYALLGYITFFTTRSRQLKAWAVAEGTPANKAAGTIHTDFEKGFIRAEVYQVADLEEFGTEAEIRHHGRMKIEGKDHKIKDGDVCLFHFNT